MTPSNDREQAISFLDRGLPERAEPLLEAWVRDHPGDLYAWKLLVRLSARKPYGVRTDRSSELLRRHAPHREVSFWRRFVYAEELLEHDEPEEAAEVCKGIVGDGFDQPAVRHCQALALVRIGRPAEADEAFRAALARDPQYLPAVDDYAVWLMLEGRLGPLERATDVIAKADPSEMARSFAQAEQTLDRIRRLREACAFQREAANLATTGNTRAAGMAVWSALRLFPESLLFIRTLAWLSRTNQWLPVCHARFEEVLPDREGIRRFADGVLAYHEGKHEDALTCLDEALAKGVERAFLHCYRALALEALERYDDEELAMARAHELQPWLIWPRAELAYHASLRGDDARILELAEVGFADRDDALRYDVTGRFDVALLERMALAALDHQGRTNEALSRVDADLNPVASEPLRFRRALALARVGQAARVADELAVALDLGSDFVGSAEPAELELVASLADLPDRPEIALVGALRCAYDEDLPEASRRLDELDRRFPGNRLILYHLTRAAWGLDDLETVREICREHPDDRRLEGLLAAVLHSAGDLTTLSELAAGGSGRVEILQAALDLAGRNDLGAAADDIAWRLLERDPGNRAALVHLADHVDPDSPAYVEILEHHVRSMPIDFENRSRLALRYLEGGRVSESLEIYEDLVGSWLAIDAFALLGLGLAALASAGERSAVAP